MKVFLLICLQYLIFPFFILSYSTVNMENSKSIGGSHAIITKHKYRSNKINLSFTSKLKKKKASEKEKFLPKINGKENPEFKNISIKFVHVDKSVEKFKKESGFTNDKYTAFFAKIMKPVKDYLTKELKVYPVSKIPNKNQKIQCQAKWTDTNGVERQFSVDVMTELGKDLKYVKVF